MLMFTLHLYLLGVTIITNYFLIVNTSNFFSTSANNKTSVFKPKLNRYTAVMSVHSIFNLHTTSSIAPVVGAFSTIHLIGHEGRISRQCLPM